MVYNHNGNQLTVTFSAPNMTRTYTYQVIGNVALQHITSTPAADAPNHPL